SRQPERTSSLHHLEKMNMRPPPPPPHTAATRLSSATRQKKPAPVFAEEPDARRSALSRALRRAGRAPRPLTATSPHRWIDVHFRGRRAQRAQQSLLRTS